MSASACWQQLIFRVMHFAELYAASRYRFRLLGDSSFALG